MSEFVVNIEKLYREANNLKDFNKDIKESIRKLNTIHKEINKNSFPLVENKLLLCISMIEQQKKSSSILYRSLLDIINLYQNTEKVIINSNTNKKQNFPNDNADEKIPDKEIYDKMMKELSDYDKECGITLVYIDGQWYYDYSLPINNRLNESLDEFRKHYISSYTEYIKKYGIALYTPDPILWKAGIVGSFLWFRDQVNHNAVWDIKREGSWRTQFGDMRYPDADETLIVNGEKMTREDMGNYTYGYLGSAMGIEDTTLYWGGGVAKNGLFSVFEDEVYNPPYYGDDKNDHIMIEKGINAYLNDYPDDIPTGSLIPLEE